LIAALSDEANCGTFNHIFLIMESLEVFFISQTGMAATNAYPRIDKETHGIVLINIFIGYGEGVTKAWGCDLNYDYGLPGVNYYDNVPCKIVELQKGAMGSLAKVSIQLNELQVSLGKAINKRLIDKLFWLE
jgi:hypothetical protein